MAKSLTITQIHSGIGRPQRQRDTLRGLGLRKVGQTRALEDSPAVRGMIARVHHLVRIEEGS